LPAPRPLGCFFYSGAIAANRAALSPVGHLVDVGGGAIPLVETPPHGSERGAALLVHGASGNFADLNVALAERDKDGVVFAHIHSVGCQRDIPGATLTVLEGVGHSPH
jgi:hypothetical protein